MDDDFQPTPKSQIGKTFIIFLSGLVAGIALTMAGQWGWQKMQQSNNIVIKLPATPSTPTNSPTPVATPIATIPPPPASLPPQLASPPPPASPKPTLSPTPKASPSPVTGQRVSFEAGTSGTTLRDTLSEKQSKRYLLECNAGQRMTLAVQEGSVEVAIIAPDGQKIGTAVAGTDEWLGELPTNGDYIVEIYAPKSSNYSVKVEVL